MQRNHGKTRLPLLCLILVRVLSLTNDHIYYLFFSITTGVKIVRSGNCFVFYGPNNDIIFSLLVLFLFIYNILKLHFTLNIYYVHSHQINVSESVILFSQIGWLQTLMTERSYRNPPVCTESV